MERLTFPVTPFRDQISKNKNGADVIFSSQIGENCTGTHYNVKGADKI